MSSFSQADLVRRVQTALDSKASGARPRDVKSLKRGLSLSGAVGVSSSEAISGPYGDLMRELRSSADPSRMSGLFLALGQNAALVSRHHECFGDLLELLFLYDWSFGDAVSAAFETILHGLVSSNAGFLQPVFQLLVQNFFPLSSEESDSDSDAAAASGRESDSEEDGAESASSAVARARACRVHGAIRSVLRIIPLGAAQLLPEIIAQFPPPGERVERQVCFVRESLRVCGYVPVLRDRIVAFVVERLVTMDADLRIDDLVVQPAAVSGVDAGGGSGADSGAAAALPLAAARGATSQQTGGEGATFMMMVEEEEEGVPRDATSGGDSMQRPEAALNTDADRKQAKRLRALAEKLDRLLEALLDFCDEQLHEGPPRAHLLFFRLMLNIFDRLMLPQTGAKFVPFLMLYICRKRADFVDQFVERLLQRALNADGDTPLVLQLSAASYLASFLARGLYIGADSTLSALQHITRWLHRYVADLERRLALGAAPRPPLYHPHHLLQPQIQQQQLHAQRLDPVDHLQFFAVCRAAVYVVMYKGEDVRAKELRVMDWTSIVGCRLRPFSHFSGDVADEFARFALDNRLLSDVQCKALREEALRWDGDDDDDDDGDDEAGGRDRQRGSPSHVSSKLADHYPFDPCLLRRTSRRVEPFYQRWLSKDGDEHAREYEQCNTAIEEMLSAEQQYEPRRPPRVEAAEAEEHEAQQEAERRLLLEGHGMLPPPIRIPGLSERAMRVLSFLGGGAAAPAPGSQESEAPNRPAGYHWGFAFGGPGSYPSSAGSMADASSPISAAGLLRAGLVQSSSVTSDAMQNASMASSLSSTGSPVMFKPYTIPIKVNKPVRGPSVASDDLSGSW
jgi:RNA polymerase I-specific transcription initiation factor RRN3